MGLVIFGAIAVYLAVSLAVVIFAARIAKKNGRSPWRWGGAVALLMYLLVFWDHIPTVLTHRYYCGKEAGFWIYKTVEQWKIENPGVMETLVYRRDMPRVETPYGRATVLNERFIHIYKHEGPLPIHRWRVEKEIRDSKTSEVIAREVSFSVSQERRQAGWSGWKFWLASDRCSLEKHRDRGSFGQITAQVEGAKK